MITCTRCGADLPDENFSKGQRMCRKCFSAYHKEWKKKNPGKSKAYKISASRKFKEKTSEPQQRKAVKAKTTQQEDKVFYRLFSAAMRENRGLSKRVRQDTITDAKIAESRKRIRGDL